MNKYGKFSRDYKEFIIIRPDTPVPWVNYLTNGTYNALITNTAGGFSFYISPRDSRITRWRYNSMPVDRPGRYIYIRNKKTGKYFSPTWQPTFTKVKNYKCIHGMNYTIISSNYDKLQTEITYFVPPDGNLEIWKVVITNKGNEPVELDIFGYVEMCLGHALVDLINQPNDQHFNDVHWDKDLQSLLATKRYWVTFTGATVKQANQEWDKIVYFTSTLPIKSFDGSKNIFIGRWRSEENPIAIEQGNCFNSEITAGDAVMAIQMPLTLKAKERKEFVILLGIEDKKDFKNLASKTIQKFRNLDEVKKQFEKLKTNNEEYLSAVKVETPDREMNIMLNVWNQYQAKTTFQFARNAGYYHGGLMFGQGYREIQDCLGTMITKPDWAKQKIIQMSHFQFKKGSTYHLFYPLTGGGEITGHSDTPLWLPMIIYFYLKETGDFDFLNQEEPYDDESEGTILEHMFRAIDYTLQNLTPRNLPKFGPGDWNDTLDYLGRKGKGESIMNAMLLCFVLKEAIELCNRLNLIEKKNEYELAYQNISKTVNEECWDGEWYVRGTNDEGDVIGSKKCEEGKIFLNTQNWAVIGGVANRERAITAMNSVKKHLDTPKGPKLLHPAYTKINPNIGLATRCVPGKKENGAVFNHGVSWAILAECLLGRGDIAYEYYRKALPMNPVIDIDRYEVEPYVYAEYVTSPDHPTFGQASHSWLTGTAVWMLRNGIDYILGAQPTYDGLKINPCISSGWRKYKITRRFRGDIYEITVKNPNGVCTGIKSIKVDGKKIKGDILPLFGDKQVHKVDVIMG